MSSRSRADVARTEPPVAGGSQPGTAGNTLPVQLMLKVSLGLMVAAAVTQWWMAVLSYFVAHRTSYDFSFYYDAALALRANPHANIYDPRVLRAAADAHHVFLGVGVFQYPPFLPILFIPLTRLSFDSAARLWFGCNLAMWLIGTILLADLLRHTLADTRFLVRLPQPDSTPMPWLVRLARWWRRLTDLDLFCFAIAVFVSIEYAPLYQALRLGQASILVFFLVTLAGWLWTRERPGWAGAALAVATLVKLLPIVLIAYFVLRGRWRVVLGSAVAAMLALAGMALVVGVQGLLAMRSILSNGLGDSARYQNEALARVPLWLNVAVTGRPSPVATLVGYGLAALLGLAFVLTVLGFLRLGARRAITQDTSLQAAGSRDLVGYGWAVCTMVLVSPISWEHHSSWLLPPFVLCLGYLMRRLWHQPAVVWMKHKAELMCLVALICGYALTMYELPFSYDGDTALDPGPYLLNHPVRPLYMVLRPLGALLMWAVAGFLFVQASTTRSRGAHSIAEPASYDSTGAVGAVGGAQREHATTPDSE